MLALLRSITEAPTREGAETALARAVETLTATYPEVAVLVDAAALSLLAACLLRMAAVVEKPDDEAFAPLMHVWTREDQNAVCLEIGRQASALPPQAAPLAAAARQLAASIGGDVAVEVHGEQMIANARLPAADWMPVSGRVLVADQNALVRDVVCRIVQRMGLAVDAAGSLDELMARLGAVGEAQGLLILIDGNLADRAHGVAVAWMVEHRPDLADRLVVLTALPTAAQTRQALEALDREWYLGKPFKAETLAALVRRRLMCLEA